MNEPPEARIRVDMTVLTMTEYFRDINEQDMFPYIDNVFKNERTKRINNLTFLIKYRY